jgi:hypothetical protein
MVPKFLAMTPIPEPFLCLQRLITEATWTITGPDDSVAINDDFAMESPPRHQVMLAVFSPLVLCMKPLHTFVAKFQVQLANSKLRSFIAADVFMDICTSAGFRHSGQVSINHPT